jgi:hypothetical protein
VGWYVDADANIDRSYKSLYHILTKLLRISDNNLEVSLRAALGSYHNWSDCLSLRSIVLKGVLSNIQASLCNGVALRKIGVRLLGIGYHTLGPRGKMGMKYGFEIFGAMRFAVPGSIVPLWMDYNMTELGGQVQITATVVGGIWRHAFGIVGLTVSIEFVLASHPDIQRLVA